MKFIRGLCSFCLQVVLIGIFVFLGLSFSIKNIFVDLVYKEGFQKEIINNVESGETNEILKVFEMEESKVFVGDIMEDIISSGDSEYDIEKEIITFIQENKDEFSETYNIQISDDDVKKLEEELGNSNLNQEYIKIKDEFKTSLGEEEKMILDIYNFIVSTTFKVILICISLIILVLIALLQKSYYKWIRSLGVVGIISGLFGIVVGLLFDYIIMQTFKMSALEMGFLAKYSIGVVLGGIVCIIVYIIINKKFNGGELQNEIS